VLSHLYAAAGPGVAVQCCSLLYKWMLLRTVRNASIAGGRTAAAAATQVACSCVCVVFHLLVAVLQVAVAAANFERRMADTAAACGVFDKLLAQDAASKEKASSGSQSESSSSSSSNGVGAIYVLYANFMKQVIQCCSDGE